MGDDSFREPFEATVPRSVYLIAAAFACELAGRRLAGDEALAHHPFAAGVACLAGIAIAWLALRERHEGERQPKWSRAELAAVGVLFLFSCAVRLVANDSIPGELTSDEGGVGISAGDVLEGRLTNPLVLGWFSFPSLYSFVEAIPIALFGRSYGALRSLSGLVGALTVIGFYWWARGFAGRFAATAGAALLAALSFHIHFSRLGLNNAWDGLFGVLVLGFFWRGFVRDRRGDFLAAGALIGASQYFYPGARVLPLALGGLAVWLLAFDRATLLRQRFHWLSMATMAAVVFAPMALFALDHPNDYFAPVRRVSLLANVFGDEGDQSWFSAESEETGTAIWMLLLGNYLAALGGFVATPLRFFYAADRPLLLAIPAVLAGLGALRLLANLRDLRTILILLLVFGIASVAALSTTVPAAQRYVLGAPIAVLVAALGVEELVRIARRFGPSAARAGTAAAVAIVALAMALDLHLYFVKFAPAQGLGAHNARTASRLGRDLAKLPHCPVFFLSNPEIPGANTFLTLAFLAPQVELIDVPRSLREGPPWGADLAQAVFVLLPGREGETFEIARAYPGGNWRKERDADGSVLYTIYEKL